MDLKGFAGNLGKGGEKGLAMCLHDFQPVALPSDDEDQPGIRVWCLKCHLSIDLFEEELPALIPVAERVREVEYLN